MKRNVLKKKINILIENEDGEICLIEADDYNEIINDYNGPYSSKVFFASYAGEPINPHAYQDFLSLAKYIRNEFCLKEQRTWLNM